MRKLMITLGIIGWLAASFIWYDGYQMTKERDYMANIAENLQLKLYFSEQEKAKAQSALQQGCVRGEAI